MSEYIRVNINFLPENQTHMSVYNEIMEAKKNKIQPTEFLINTVLELRKYKAEKQNWRNGRKDMQSIWNIGMHRLVER